MSTVGYLPHSIFQEDSPWRARDSPFASYAVIVRLKSTCQFNDRTFIKDKNDETRTSFKLLFLFAHFTLALFEWHPQAILEKGLLLTKRWAPNCDSDFRSQVEILNSMEISVESTIAIVDYSQLP